MKMTTPENKSDAHLILTELWAERPEAEAGRAIVDFLALHTDAVHISFSQLFAVADEVRIKDRAVVLNIINYFTGADLNLLTTGFEYIEDETVQPLDIEQVRAAKFNNINPVTGDEDSDIGKKIFMFFKPSQLAKTALVVD